MEAAVSGESSVRYVEQQAHEHNVRPGDAEWPERTEPDPAVYGEVAASVHGAIALVEADAEWTRPARAAVREASEQRLEQAVASVVDLALQHAAIAAGR